jgi:hypothetical protein
MLINIPVNVVDSRSSAFRYMWHNMRTDGITDREIDMGKSKCPLLSEGTKICYIPVLSYWHGTKHLILIILLLGCN